MEYTRESTSYRGWPVGRRPERAKARYASPDQCTCAIAVCSESSGAESRAGQHDEQRRHDEQDQRQHQQRRQPRAFRLQRRSSARAADRRRPRAARRPAACRNSASGQASWPGAGSPRRPSGGRNWRTPRAGRAAPAVRRAGRQRHAMAGLAPAISVATWPARFPAPCPLRCRPPADRARPAGRAARPRDRDGDEVQHPVRAQQPKRQRHGEQQEVWSVPGNPSEQPVDRSASGNQHRQQDFRAEHHRQQAGGIEAGGGRSRSPARRCPVRNRTASRRPAARRAGAAAGRANPPAARRRSSPGDRGPAGNQSSIR